MLRSLTFGLGCVYALFAVLNAVRLPMPAGRSVVAANVLLLIVYWTASLWLRRFEVEARWAEPAIAAVFLLANTNTLNSLRLFEQPLYLVFVALAFVGLAAFSTSAPWFALGSAAMAAEWLALHALVLDTPGQTLWEHSFFLVAAVCLAMVIFASRRRARRDLDRQEDLLRKFAQASRQVIWVFDPTSNRFVFVNDAFEDLSGWTPESLLESADLFFELFLPEDAGQVRELIRRSKQGELLTTEHRLLTRDSQVKWVRLNVFPLEDDHGAVSRLAGVSEDVTEDRQLREELTVARNRLRAREQVLWQFVKNTPAAVAMFDDGMRYVAASERWRTVYGLDDQDLIGRSHYEVFPEIGERWKEIHRRCLAGATERAEEDPFPRADGSMSWLRWEIQPWRSESGEIAGLLMFTEDITREKHLRDSLRSAARHDDLTECLTRRALLEDLDRLWSRASAEGFALLYLDLDRFKEVNDRFGHSAGDDVLRQVSERLRSACRPGDIIGRLGGDELVVAALGIRDRGTARHLASRIRSAIENEILTRAGTVRIGVSIGVVLARDAASVEELLERGDEAMYAEKVSSRTANPGANPGQRPPEPAQ